LPSESAEDDENLFPFGQLRVLHDVRQVVGDDGLEQSKIRESCGTTLEIRLLSLCQEFRTALDSEDECVRESVDREGECDGRLKVAEDQRTGDQTVDLGLIGRIDLEGVDLEIVRRYRRCSGSDGGSHRRVLGIPLMRDGDVIRQSGAERAH
jgi:hypothetical protein